VVTKLLKNEKAFEKIRSSASFCSSLCKSAHAQVSVGPEVGFTAAGLYSSEEDVYAGLNGHFGFTAHIQLGNFLAVRPSILFRSGSMAYTDDDQETITLTRISIPVPIMYSHVFDNGSVLFAGAGPNFMYSFSGKYKYGSESQKIEFGTNEEQIKPFDIGLHLKAGYQFAPGLVLSTFFNAGFTDLDNVDGQQFKSLDAIGFSIGWMFGGKSNE
jgi:hypothetical protein